VGIDIKTLPCNAACASCYENTIRQCGGGPKLDFDKVLGTLRGAPGAPSLHGGEPLLLGKRKVEQLFKIIMAKCGQNGIQTNGLLIDNEWIDMFVKYNVNVGVSLDGDTPLLNAGRFSDAFKIQHVLNMVRKMKMAGLSVSVIAVLRRHNAAENRIDLFVDFLRHLADDCYINYVRTNPGIAFTPETEATEQLGDVEMGVALCRIAEACLSDKRFKWQPVRDVVEMLAGFSGRSPCNFAGCDVWHTESEQPILADGSFGNCMKGGGAPDGVANLRADKASGARSEALAQIDMEHGGCRECRWWQHCHGGCPGEALGNDYRNRTRFCRSYQMLFEYVQRRLEGLLPSIDVEAAAPMRNLANTTWAKQYMTEAPPAAVETVPAAQPVGHGDSHGDRPHGDSNDAAWRRANPQWGR
jgi:uncharacterized protein